MLKRTIILETPKYLMENKDECLRMDIKTDFSSLENQSKWAGIKSGMSVADIGCGSGITSSFLKRIVGETGHVTGIDGSSERINYAIENYAEDGLDFVNININNTLDEMNKFDFIWVRFFLEYHKQNSLDIVKKLKAKLHPGGIICLVDLDNNSLSHYGQSSKLENTMNKLSRIIEDHGDFDPYAGRKLYSYLFDLGFKEIELMMNSHHLIYGKLSKVDEFNWTKKIEVAAQNSGYSFEEYSDGYNGFVNEFNTFFSDPKRFTYTPIISCRGIR
jgi:ubiquinone/menaquinone biosynthesis C-methylase UbiE